MSGSCCTAGGRCLAWAMLAVWMLAVSGGCRDKRSEQAPPMDEVRPATPADPATPAPGNDWNLPDDASLRRTTEPTRAVANLERRIDNLLRAVTVDGTVALKDAQEHLALTPKLVPLLLIHAQMLGYYGDFQKALTLTERYVERRPEQASAYLLRARARAAVHRFEEALADIARAEELGARASGHRDQRAAVAHALGDYATALALWQELASVRPTIQSLGSLATVHADMGALELAEQKFREALDAPGRGDVFAVAWICFQWGRMYEEAGQHLRARHLYQLAHRRAPWYNPMIGHLAGLWMDKSPERAIALLEKSVQRTDDPEHLGVLAQLVREAGDESRATVLMERARAGFERLLGQFPDAFADHAARHFWRFGKDLPRAHQLAQHNLRVRQTSAAHVLALEVAIAAGEYGRACEVADLGIKLQFSENRFLFLSWQAFSKCERLEDAEKMEKRLGMDKVVTP